MSVLSKAARLFSRNKRAELEHHTVAHEKIDEGILGEWKGKAQRLDDVYDNPPPIETRDHADRELWSDLVDDSFFSFFGYDEPQVLDQDQIAPSRQINRVIADKFSRSDQMNDLRPATKNRPLEAALATVAAADALRESMGKEMKEHTERASEMAELERTLRQLEEQLEQMRQQNQQAPGAHAAQEMRQTTQARQQARQDLARKEQEQAIAAPQIAGACQSAVQRAVAAADQAVDQMKSIPGLGLGKAPGTTASVSPDVMFDLAKRWSQNKRLKKISDMIGKMLADLRTTRRTKRKRGVEEIVDIETGNDIPALLPSELAKLRHPVMRLDFYRRFAEAQLMQYERVSTEEQKKGPMIVVVDESSSMDGAPLIWAKATMLCLLMIGNREHRPVATVSFGSPNQVKNWVFPRNKALDPVAVTDAAEHFFNGGTSTLTGMLKAMRIMEEDAPFHHADVVLITDGADAWTEDDETVRDRLRSMGVTIHGVTLGIPPTDYTLQMCEKTVSVQDFQEKTDAGRHLASHIN